MRERPINNIDSSKAILWASAFVIGALVIMQAGRLPGHPAYADSVSEGQHYTVLTADSGRGGDEDPDEILIIIDNRSEMIMSYSIDQPNGALLPRDGGSLPNFFRSVLKR